MSKRKDVHIFGIRHLSPSGAYHLNQFLDAIQPTAVLIEGPSDANSQMEHFTALGTVPPIAILAYTSELPIRTVLYPFATYSPELQAILWANKRNVHAAFIDVPSDIMIALERTENTVETTETVDRPGSIYEQIAQLAGENSYESFWEKNFEHQLHPASYLETMTAFSHELRELTEVNEKTLDTWEYARNLTREAYMRRQIKQTIDDGHSPDKIVVVTGAYHAHRLSLEHPVMTDQELKQLPRQETSLTLMPYSYFKLSNQSGYGAGNEAPSYFEMMWECLLGTDLEKLPTYYLTSIASHLRDKGTFRSTAEVIEGVRLAFSLAGLKNGRIPALADLRDAAMISLGQGDLSIIAEAMAKTEIGTAIGTLPEGVSKTPVQDDFYRELKRLKLEKYRTPVATELELDLRENRRVKSKEAAFLDLHRSFFLHRMSVLGVHFAQKKIVAEQAIWSEKWVLRWVPETEIHLVESTLLGETIRLAAAFVLKERLEQSESIADAAAIIRTACECGMGDSIEVAKKRLQQLAVDAGDFQQLADAVRDLSFVISFGDVRQFDSQPLIPILQQLFLRATLLLVNSASCKDEVAKQLMTACNIMNQVSKELYDVVDSDLWLAKVTELSDRDDRNALLSGYACSLLLERNQMSNEKLAAEVSRRLSPGISADLGAGWFEGLAMRNVYALLSRQHLWEQLDTYLASLDSEQFMRALVFLRRSFGTFRPSEKVRVAELLGEIWKVDPDMISEALHQELTDQEQEVLDTLNDFDFGDL